MRKALVWTARVSLVVALVSGGSAAAMTLGSNDDNDVAAPVVATATKPAETQARRKPTPAPTSAKGYVKMFDKAYGPEWGGGDVSLSRKLRDGRVVWLFGDTFSKKNGMVHSTAMVQTGGDLKVSNGGKQILPNTGKTIYWIEDAKAVGQSSVDVTAAPMLIGQAGTWDFKRADERSRVARLFVSKTGSVRFVGWRGYVPMPVQFNDLTITAVPGGEHYQYERRSHPEAKLSSGKCLSTKNNNWGLGGKFKTLSDGSIDFKAYRASFSETATCGRA